MWGDKEMIKEIKDLFALDILEQEEFLQDYEDEEDDLFSKLSSFLFL